VGRFVKTCPNVKHYPWKLHQGSIFYYKTIVKSFPQIFTFLNLKKLKIFGEKKFEFFFLKAKIKKEHTKFTFSPFDHDVNVIRSNINYIDGCNLDK
jgi:hypothetical protein